MIYFLMVFQQLIASSTHIIAKDATSELHPVFVVFIRGAFSFVFYGIFLLVRKRLVKPISSNDWWLFLIQAVINIPVNQHLFIWSLKYTTPANASLAYALTPVFVVLFSRFRETGALSAIKLVGIGVAFLGAAIVLFEHGVSFDSQFFLGNVLVLMASGSWAVYTIVGQPLAVKYGAIYATAIPMFIGEFLFVPIFYFFAPEISWTSVTQSQWLELAYLGIVTSGVGFALWYYLLSKRDMAKVAVFQNLQPALTMILMAIFLRISPTPVMIVGSAIAIFGVILTQRARQ